MRRLQPLSAMMARCRPSVFCLAGRRSQLGRWVGLGGRRGRRAARRLPPAESNLPEHDLCVREPLSPEAPGSVCRAGPLSTSPPGAAKCPPEVRSVSLFRVARRSEPIGLGSTQAIIELRCFFLEPLKRGSTLIPSSRDLDLPRPIGSAEYSHVRRCSLNVHHDGVPGPRRSAQCCASGARRRESARGRAPACAWMRACSWACGRARACVCVCVCARRLKSSEKDLPQLRARVCVCV